MMHEKFHGVSVFGKTILSAGATGNHSAVICAYWTWQEEGINSDNLCYSKILYFFRHCMSCLSSLKLVTILCLQEFSSSKLIQDRTGLVLTLQL